MKPKEALPPRTYQSGQMAVLLAGMYTVMSLAQLFTFEDFVVLIGQVLPVGDLSLAVASVVVSMEVFAIPFLLRMHLSDLFRWISMVFGWVTSLLWVLVAYLSVNIYPSPASTAMFGGLPVEPGWWTVLFSLGVGILVIWSSWGLWPGRK